MLFIKSQKAKFGIKCILVVGYFSLPCLYSTFHLEYPLVLSRFCFSTSWFISISSPYDANFFTPLIYPTKDLDSFFRYLCRVTLVFIFEFLKLSHNIFGNGIIPPLQYYYKACTVHVHVHFCIFYFPTLRS